MIYSTISINSCTRTVSRIIKLNLQLGEALCLTTSDLPVSFTAVKPIIPYFSLRGNKKAGRKKSVMEFSEHWQALLRFPWNDFALLVCGSFR